MSVLWAVGTFAVLFALAAVIPLRGEDGGCGGGSCGSCGGSGACPLGDADEGPDRTVWPR